MAYLIDTDWSVDRLLEAPDAVDLFDRITPDGVALSIISYIELFHGSLKNPDRSRPLEAFLLNVPLLPITPAVARRCAAIRHDLQFAGKRIHNRALDLIIAETAIEHRMTLVTRNTADYTDIPGIDIYAG